MSFAKSSPNGTPGVAEVELSSAARADLVEIDDFGEEQYGREIADVYAFGFEEAFDRLASFPNSGQAYPELGRGIRCIVHRKHRVFYTVNDDLVLIVRIIHHAQDARRALN